MRTGRPHFQAVLVAEKLPGQLGLLSFPNSQLHGDCLGSCGRNQSTLESMWKEFPNEKIRHLQSRESHPWLGKYSSHSLYSGNTKKSKEKFYIVYNLIFQTQFFMQIRLQHIYYLYQSFPTNIMS